MGRTLRPGHVLSHSLASIEQACSGMQVTIAHERSRHHGGGVHHAGNREARGSGPCLCKSAQSLFVPRRTIYIRREYYTARRGVETRSDRSMEWWLFGQSSDGLRWVHDITLAIRHRRIANVWPRSDRNISFRKEDLADAFDPFEHSGIDVLSGLFDLYRSHRSTASLFRLEFMN